MKRVRELERYIEFLKDRLSRLSEASLHISETLDLDMVLQGVLDSACSLTDARYGTITILNQSGQVEDFISSGMSPEQRRQMWDMPEALGSYLNPIPGPLRVRDFHSYARSLGLPEFGPIAEMRAFLAVPIRYQGRDSGAIYLTKSAPDEEFSREDEETLVLFALQAALVIDNARRYHAEQRHRSYLETLVDTSPVGVVVFDAGTGALTSLNLEARRIIDSLRNPEQSLEHLLETMTVRRADGRETSAAQAAADRGHGACLRDSACRRGRPESP